MILREEETEHVTSVKNQDTFRVNAQKVARAVVVVSDQDRPETDRQVAKTVSAKNATYQRKKTTPRQACFTQLRPESTFRSKMKYQPICRVMAPIKSFRSNRLMTPI
jgi:hypothetical protein